MKTKKTKTRHRVTFAHDQDSMCLALAKLGQSTRVIARDCRLTESQIIYRLSKAKRLEEEEHGYRVAWRSGESDLVQQIKADFLGVLQHEIQRNLPKLIHHPEPEIAPAGGDR